MVWLIIKLLSIVHIDIYIYTPLGPTVRETASASLSIPACKASLHSLPNNIFLGPAHTTKRGVLRTPNATVWFQRKGCNNKNSVVRNLEESERAKVKILIEVSPADYQGLGKAYLRRILTDRGFGSTTMLSEASPCEVP